MVSVLEIVLAVRGVVHLTRGGSRRIEGSGGEEVEYLTGIDTGV